LKIAIEESRVEPTLKERMTGWTDLEEAAFLLARSLGVMGPEVARMGDAKSVFWSKNKVGDALYRVLKELVDIGALVENENDSSLVKWSPAFRGSWEKP
jgi:hypothetical protein